MIRVLCSVVAVLLLVGCSPLDSGRTKPLDLADVGELAHLTFPDGARLTSSTYQAFQDWYLTAVVEFPATELDGLLAANSLEPTEGLRAVTNDDRQLEPAWEPESATTVLGLDLTGEPVSGVYRKLLFDRDQPDTVVLYLVAFTT